MASASAEVSKSTNLVSEPQDSTNKVSLVVLMGLPASGKSTLANTLKSHNPAGWRTVVISFDNFISLPIQVQIIQELITDSKGKPGSVEKDGGDDNLNEFGQAKALRKKFVCCVDILVKFLVEIRSGDPVESVKETCLKNLESTLNAIQCSSKLLVSDNEFLGKMSILFDEVSFAVEHGKILIIVDDNNYYHSMRNDFYQIAKNAEIGFCILYCKTPLKTCLQRNSSRSLDVQVPSKAIVEMSLKFEEPNPLQNVCDVYSLQVDTVATNQDQGSSNTLNLVLLEQLISNSFQNPLKKNEDRTEEIERERRICSENEVHQADLHLRKWISKKLNLDCLAKGIGTKNNGESCKDFRKNLSADLNLRKRQTLEKLRSGELKVSYQVSQDVEFRDDIIKMFENIQL